MAEATARPQNRPSEAVCVFCGADAPEPISLSRFGANSCTDCAVRVGKLVSTPRPVIFELWPMLAEQDDDLEPEPRVRKSDGTMVELREVTAEMKRDLPLEKRL